MRPVSVPALAALACWLLAAGAASAGSYEVLACEAAPGNANNSWTVTNTAPSHMTSQAVCPRLGDDFGGLRVFDTFMALDTPDGNVAEWTFQAPAGTTISALRYRRYLGKDGGDSWSIYGKTGGGAPFDTCHVVLPADECAVGGPGFPEHVIAGLSTDRLIFGMACVNQGGGTCANGAFIHSAWVSLYAAAVTLTESSAPSVGPVSGLLVAPGWHRDSESVSFDASDGVGIKETRVYVDNVQRSAIPHTCDYTLPVPCTNPGSAVTHVIDTTQLLDGERELEVAAIDAAGNERRDTPITVQVDNNAPGGLFVAGSASGSQIGVSWGASDGTGSGVASYDVAVSTNGGAFQPWLAATTATSGSYPGAAGHSYVFRMQARDNSGLLSGFATVQTTVPSPPPSGSQAGPGVAGTQPPGGDAPPGEPPTVEPRRTPALRLRSARVRGGRLHVSGVLPASTRGRVTITYTARVGRRRVRVRRTVRASAGRFNLATRLSRRAASARSGTLTIRFAGDERYLPRTLRATVSSR